MAICDSNKRQGGHPPCRLEANAPGLHCVSVGLAVVVLPAFPSAVTLTAAMLPPPGTCRLAEAAVLTWARWLCTATCGFRPQGLFRSALHVSHLLGPASPGHVLLMVMAGAQGDKHIQDSSCVPWTHTRHVAPLTSHDNGCSYGRGRIGTGTGKRTLRSVCGPPLVLQP